MRLEDTLNALVYLERTDTWAGWRVTLHLRHGHTDHNGLLNYSASLLNCEFRRIEVVSACELSTVPGTYEALIQGRGSGRKGWPTLIFHLPVARASSQPPQEGHEAPNRTHLEFATIQTSQP